MSRFLYAAGGSSDAERGIRIPGMRGVESGRNGTR